MRGVASLAVGREEGFRNQPVKNVVNLFPDVCSQSKELSIDPMESRLQEIPLTGVFAVK